MKKNRIILSSILLACISCSASLEIDYDFQAVTDGGSYILHDYDEIAAYTGSSLDAYEYETQIGIEASVTYGSAAISCELMPEWSNGDQNAEGTVYWEDTLGFDVAGHTEGFIRFSFNFDSWISAEPATANLSAYYELDLSLDDDSIFYSRDAVNASGSRTQAGMNGRFTTSATYVDFTDIYSFSMMLDAGTGLEEGLGEGWASAEISNLTIQLTDFNGNPISGTIDADSATSYTTVIPEPATLSLLGLTTVAVFIRRRFLI